MLTLQIMSYGNIHEDEDLRSISFACQESTELICLFSTWNNPAERKIMSAMIWRSLLTVTRASAEASLDFEI